MAGVVAATLPSKVISLRKIGTANTAEQREINRAWVLVDIFELLINSGSDFIWR